jgi:hypothetical protein
MTAGENESGGGMTLLLVALNCARKTDNKASDRNTN